MEKKDGFYFWSKGEDEKISDNFWLREFECKCNVSHENKISVKLVDKMQVLRNYLNELAKKFNAFININKPISITITSGDRCEDHNLTVGGKPHSPHKLSIANDMKINNYKGLRYDKLAMDCRNLSFTGIGVYTNRLHLDVRDGSKHGMGYALYGLKIILD